MMEEMKRSGRLRTALAFIATCVAISGGAWALSISISETVSSNVRETSREVIKDELAGFNEQVEREVDKKIQVHKLESEIEIQRQYLAIQTQQAAMQAKLDEISRRMQ